MNERSFYRCEVCGNIVGLMHDGGGELVCCNKPMVRLVPNTVDAAKEKHVPVYEKEGNLLKVKVGSVEHPMTEEHWIQWVVIEEPECTHREILKPGDSPSAEFELHGDKYEVFAYCNLHGLWKA